MNTENNANQLIKDRIALTAKMAEFIIKAQQRSEKVRESLEKVKTILAKYK